MVNMSNATELVDIMDDKNYGAELPARVSARPSPLETKAQPTAPPGLCGDVWVCRDEGWVLMHQFNMGLEYERPLNNEVDQSRSVLHLPSTSLGTLQQLRASMEASKAIALDRTLKGSSDLVTFLQEAVDLAAEHGDLDNVGHREASQTLKRRTIARRAGSKDSSCVDNFDRSIIMSPEDGEDSIDISVCPIPGLDGAQTPVLALLGLACPIAIDDSSGISISLKYVAIILCSPVSSSTSIACRMARALASTFMDRTFAEDVRRQAARGTQGVLPAFDAYLAHVTIVPTVYVPRSTMPDDSSEADGQYLLSESLADAIKTRIYKGRAPSATPEKDRTDFPAPKNERLRTTASISQNGYLEIHKFSAAAREWLLTHCLRQALEVDDISGSSKPHMPCVSVHVLASVQRLINFSSVGLDVRTDTLEQCTESMLRQLSNAGLPDTALESTRVALQLTAERDCVHSKEEETEDELFKPCDTDEPCIILEIPSSALEPSAGFFGAFLRFQSQLKLPFTLSGSASKLVFVLVGSDEKEEELTALGHSLAALCADEDLMDRFSSARDAAAFVGAVEARLNDLIVIPGSRAVPQAEDDDANADAGAVRRVASLSTRPSMARRNSVKGLITSVVSFKEAAPIDSTEGSTARRTRSSFSSVSSSLSWSIEEDKTWFQAMKDKAIFVQGYVQKFSLPLVFGVITALAWSNLDEHSYHDFIHTPIPGFKMIGHEVNLHFIVNDIFMVFYFGLAIKEIVEAVLPGGSLSPIRRAVNPLLATLGGVLVPIAIYCVMVYSLEGAGFFDDTMCFPTDADGNPNLSAPSSSKEVCELSSLLQGWGVPTSTDIALAWMFALIIFGAGHPCINVLLLLVILDDAIGMIIIAVFYPDPKHPVEPVWFLLSLAAMAVSFVLRRLKVPFWQPYVFLAGPISWLGLIKAHVHPALALAFVVPFMPHKNPKPAGIEEDTWGSKKSRLESPSEGDDPSSPGLAPGKSYTDGFKKMRKLASRVANALEPADSGEDSVTLTGRTSRRKTRQHRKTVKLAAELLLHLSEAPLHAFEHTMKLPVDIGMFFFGLANAGVSLGEVGGITVSVVVALLVGKTLGITAFSLLAIQLGFGLPSGVSVGDLFAMSALGGVGLTVALFVANEAFVDPGLRGQAKMGAVLSVFSAGLAFAIKLVAKRFEPQPDSDDELASPMSPRLDDCGVDGEMVDTILQVMWTARKYKARGVAMPLSSDKIVRAGSKSVIERSGSKSARSGSKVDPKCRSMASMESTPEGDETEVRSVSKRTESKDRPTYNGAFPQGCVKRPSDLFKRQTSPATQRQTSPSPATQRQTSPTKMAWS